MTVELGPIGMRSNAIAASFVLTPFNLTPFNDTPFNDQRRDLDDMEAMIAKYVALTLLRRLIDPEVVANAVAFRPSDRACNITGEVIDVYAGSQLPPTV